MTALLRRPRVLLTAVLAVGLLLPAAPASAQTDPLWIAIDGGPISGYDNAVGVAVNPVNGTVNVTGAVPGRERRPGQFTNFDYANVAYRAGDGARVARALYNGPGTEDPDGLDNDFPSAIAADPRSGNVYVTGTSQGMGTGRDYATVAYGPNGARLWVARYHGGGTDNAMDMTVNPATGDLYVTGWSARGGAVDYATVAYGRDGRLLWEARYNAGGGGSNLAEAVAVDPASGNVYVTGSSSSGAEDQFATVAYSAAGDQLWAVEYDRDGNDRPSDIAVDPGNGNVYVTGFSAGSPTNAADLATVAYRADGTPLWEATYDDPDDRTAVAVGLAVHPLTGDVSVAGTLEDDFGVSSSILTLTYSAGGTTLWADEYAGAGNAVNRAVAISLDQRTGTTYVTGMSDTFEVGVDSDPKIATIAYDNTGNRLRADIYDSTGSDVPQAMAVDAGTGRLYVTGYTTALDEDGDYLTLAYPAAGR